MVLGVAAYTKHRQSPFPGGVLRLAAFIGAGGALRDSGCVVHHSQVHTSQGTLLIQRETVCHSHRRRRQENNKHKSRDRNIKNESENMKHKSTDRNVNIL